MLDENKKYSRKANVVYLNNMPVLELLQNFPDFEELSQSAVKYINKYIKLNPSLVKTLEMKKNKDIVKFFFDLETTGVEVKKHSIHQISGCIEVNDEVVEYFDFKVAPNPKALIDPQALHVCGVTEEQIKEYPEMKVVFRQLTKMLNKYASKYDPTDKIWLVGFNNRKFDDIFFRAWFEQNGDTFFGSWFWTDSLDVIVLASQYLINRRRSMSSFKLKRVALELGIAVDESKLHDAKYDIDLTRYIYRIVTGLDIEI
jgi:DNA polymerase-3 subunit epsilon